MTHVFHLRVGTHYSDKETLWGPVSRAGLGRTDLATSHLSYRPRASYLRCVWAARYVRMRLLRDCGRDKDIGCRLCLPGRAPVALLSSHPSITDSRTVGAVISNTGSLYYIPPGANSGGYGPMGAGTVPSMRVLPPVMRPGQWVPGANRQRR